MTPNTIEFQTTSNTLMDGWVMRITADRRIEVNENVDVNESAKKVLEAMQLMLDKQKRTWVGLTEEDLKLLSAEWRIVYGAWMDDFAKDIEAKIKEKNT
jgi:hypothetical protein